MENERIEMTKEEVVRKCEIAYIVGKMEGKNEIENNNYDMFQMYDNIYNPIYNEWSNGIENDIFKNNDEEAYISSYAERRIKELYSK